MNKQLLQQLKDARLIVDYDWQDGGSYSVIFQPSIPNLELSELFGKVRLCTYETAPPLVREIEYKFIELACARYDNDLFELRYRT